MKDKLHKLHKHEWICIASNKAEKSITHKCIECGKIVEVISKEFGDVVVDIIE